MFVSPIFSNSEWTFTLSLFASLFGGYSSALIFTMICCALTVEKGKRAILFTLNYYGIVRGDNDVIWLWSDYQRTAQTKKNISVDFSRGGSVCLNKKFLEDHGAMVKSFINKRKTLEAPSLDTSLDMYQTPRSKLSFAPLWLMGFQFLLLIYVYHKIKDLSLNSSNVFISFMLFCLIMFFVTILRSGVPYKKMLSVSPDGLTLYKGGSERDYQWSDFSSILGSRSRLILKIDDQKNINFYQDEIGYANIHMAKLYIKKFAPAHLVTLHW